MANAAEEVSIPYRYSICSAPDTQRYGDKFGFLSQFLIGILFVPLARVRLPRITTVAQSQFLIGILFVPLLL